MALIVQKFGGTSVGSIERIEAVADLVVKTRQQGHQVVVVLSAMSGETNRLINLAKQIDTRPSSRELDVLISTGEQVSVSLLAMAIIKRGHSAVSLLADQVNILTDNMFGKARIAEVAATRLKHELEHNRIAIIAGFQGRDIEGNITTLGRGGTDTSAVEIAAAIKADECQIYTDVDGVYTTDPRVEPNARRMSQVTFAEMLELASLGAKVLHIRSVEAAGRHNVPLRVLSSFNPDEGTLISFEENDMPSKVVSGIAFNRDECLIKVDGVPSGTQYLSKILKLFADNGIEIDMINQVNHIFEKIDYAFTVHSNDYLQALELLSEDQAQLSAQNISGLPTVAKVSAVGMGMKSHSGVASLFFDALAQENINVVLVSTSEIKISVLIDEKYLELAVRALHKAFLTENG
ncbi:MULTISPECIES: aspartate kinase [Pseudoalteromonas]|uniref:Aspartokinase n=2 Tax=Pseudoalteromonas arctica TaxID=394751 RepID=A0A290S6L6_9GAMM|nr:MULTISPECIES: aspartate kinase [Pseudoalteromonas]MBG9991387.1 aspartate kinase [Pseudoalteromonas sp. NZS37]MBH0080491.1 aspartate kinase [Pseudoalteromonas sp. NZS11]ATC87703.1 aspartate kinase [Pseudoalteromonas arctica A 37-1-2]MBZ2194059.1 aspartate kinase [Pseudoalteromonas arctica]GAA68100.1 aspartate kinase [Pseudoalteromonas sp. BSi20429]